MPMAWKIPIDFCHKKKHPKVLFCQYAQVAATVN